MNALPLHWPHPPGHRVPWLLLAAVAGALLDLAMAVRLNQWNAGAGFPAIRSDWMRHALGMGDPVALSAEHGEGMGDLFDALRPLLEGEEEDDDDDAFEPFEDDAAEADEDYDGPPAGPLERPPGGRGRRALR